ncbi:MAG: multicopper oxidase domain-containing protein [Gemmatimonadaceae bacterium]
MADRVATNDNRISAGVMTDGVLTVQLDARVGEWHPDRDADPGVSVHAFGEAGKRLQIPGPRIRVRAGTVVRVSRRNALDTPNLTVHGFTAPGAASSGMDTVQIAPGVTRQLQFVATVPGTYYYWGTSTGAPDIVRDKMDSQLSGRPRRNAAPEREVRNARALRLIVRNDSGGTELEPSYGYELRAPRLAHVPAAPLLPGPTLVLTRNEPVAITVVNEIPEPTAVHWHGIELESYFDGVAGFAGRTGRSAPAIAPRDSFVPRFTPPRAGTFIYHPHADELRQQQAGLAGAIVVLDSGESFNPETDIELLISVPRKEVDVNTVLLHGSNVPAAREWRVGQRYRLRVIDIHTARPSMTARL